MSERFSDDDLKSHQANPKARLATHAARALIAEVLAHRTKESVREAIRKQAAERLTLRELAAVAAMEGLLAGSYREFVPRKEFSNEVVEAAVDQADRLIAALRRKQP